MKAVDNNFFVHFSHAHANGLYSLGSSIIIRKVHFYCIIPEGNSIETDEKEVDKSNSLYKMRQFSSLKRGKMAYKWGCRLLEDKIEVFRDNESIGHYDLLSEPYCKRCSKPEEESSNGWCPSCTKAYGYERVYAVGIYVTTRTYKIMQDVGLENGGLLSKHAYLFKKYPGYYSYPLALAMSVCLEYTYNLKEEIDIITAVPAHSEQIEEVGFNRIDKIGDILSRQVGISFNNSLLHKTKNISMHYEDEETGKMKSRPLDERYELVKGLYKATIEIPNKRILLIDDIYTTGANSSECSKQLLNAGAKNVKVMVAGRAY